MPNEDLVNTPKVIGDEIEVKDVDFTEDVITIDNSNNISNRSFKKYNIGVMFDHGVVIKDQNRAPKTTDTLYSITNTNYPIGSLWIYNNNVWILSSITVNPNTGQDNANWLLLDGVDPSVNKFSNSPSGTYDVKNSNRKRRYDVYNKYKMIINGVSTEVYTNEVNCLTCAGRGCHSGCETACKGSCAGGCGGSLW